MFGQNNNSQTTNPSPAPTDTAPPMPVNPFAENDAAVPTPPAPESVVAPTPKMSTPAVDPAAATPATPVAQPASSVPAVNDDLLSLKQQALQSLQPLVNHLDQSPEEKFKTTMMLIQASDNSALVRQAYDAANQITDEKTRAHALLDVVNEINYFTQKEPQP